MVGWPGRQSARPDCAHEPDAERHDLDSVPSHVACSSLVGASEVVSLDVLMASEKHSSAQGHWRMPEGQLGVAERTPEYAVASESTHSAGLVRHGRSM